MQHSEVARILEDDVKHWSQVFGSDPTKKKAASRAPEEAALGKRKSLQDESSKHEDTITIDDLIFMLRTTPKYANSELLIKASTKQLQDS